MLKEHGRAYTLIRSICGLYFVLQGFAQINFTGRRLFPNVNLFFVKSYKTYVHSVAWQRMGLNPTADQFREIIGCVILVLGMCLVLDKHVKFCAVIMCLLGVWSVYAHILAADPTYTVVCGAIISVLMFLLAIAHKNHKKVD